MKAGEFNVAVAIVRLGLVVMLTMVVSATSSEAQPREHARRIGFLSSGSSSNSAAFDAAFREGLRDLGWVEGQNIAIDFRFVEGRFDRLPDLAAELVRRSGKRTPVHRSIREAQPCRM